MLKVKAFLHSNYDVSHENCRFSQIASKIARAPLFILTFTTKTGVSHFEYHQKNVPVYASNEKMKDASNTGKKDIQFCMSTNDDTKKIRCQVVSTPTTITPSIMSSSFSSIDQSVTKRRLSVEKAFDCYFYVVHNNEIVGRYGANLIDALSQIRLLSGKSRSHPDNRRALKNWFLYHLN